MPEFIRFLCVENQPNRKNRPSRQKISFLIQVANIAYHKQVEVFWRPIDGEWQSIAANYLQTTGSGEIWQAETRLAYKRRQTPPEGIEFACRLSTGADEYWDNNQGNNYQHNWQQYIQLHPQQSLLNLSFETQLTKGQNWLTIKLLLNPLHINSPPLIYWTKDQWRNQKCVKTYLQKSSASASAQIWSARIRLHQVFRLQYAIAYTSGEQSLWDNNQGQNYHIGYKPLQVMILNLHCYQESQQDEKFSTIAKAIDDLDVDVVCLQEAAEPWNYGHGDWQHNAAHIINQRLKHAFDLFYDWSHLGFDQFREGVAILSRYPLQNPKSGYVSDSCDAYNMHARKVVTAQITVPHLGDIQVFSVHLSWWEDGFAQQFQRLAHWADSLNSTKLKAILLCGDFNIQANSPAYQQVIQQYQYSDQYLTANQQGLPEAYRVNDAHWRAQHSQDYRIDYIFMHPQGQLQACAARVLFTEHDYGRVSDHFGYLFSFEPAI